jgi:putative transposase
MDVQTTLQFPSRWGGARRGAGRKPNCGRSRSVPHRARPAHSRHTPVHVTLRARAGLPSLRAPRLFAPLRDALSASSKETFRLLQFSVQGDHLHLIVEADDRASLTSGLRGLAIRTARAFNKAAARRGSLWSDRYHAHPLTSPRETRRALVYVLFNFKKHRPADGAPIDPCSSAPWFDGFRTRLPQPAAAPPIRAAVSWLARKGWQTAGGPISLQESPTLPIARPRPVTPSSSDASPPPPRTSARSSRTADASRSQGDSFGPPAASNRAPHAVPRAGGPNMSPLS